MPEIKPDNALNLSISVSAGKEINRDSLSSGERTGMSSSCKSPTFGGRVVSWGVAILQVDRAHKAFWNRPAKRVKPPYLAHEKPEESNSQSQIAWDCCSKSRDILLPRLNIDGKPIANKYCEGKMKRTLKRGLKDLKPLRRKLWELVKCRV